MKLCQLRGLKDLSSRPWILLVPPAGEAQSPNPGKWKKVKVPQSCLIFVTHWTSVSRPAGFSVHGILQARVLEWVAIPFSRISS